MPVQRCQKGNLPGFKGGPSDNFRCFTYEPGDKQSRDRARQMAEEQLRAVKAIN